MHILNSCVVYQVSKLSTLGVPYPSHISSLLDCHLTRHSLSLMFLQL